MSGVPIRRQITREIKKRENCVIRISTAELAGHRFIELRQHYRDKHGEFQPSEKGITLQPELLDELIESLVELKQRMALNK